MVGKAPAMGRDSQSLTNLEIYESLPDVNRRHKVGFPITEIHDPLGPLHQSSHFGNLSELGRAQSLGPFRYSTRHLIHHVTIPLS